MAHTCFAKFPVLLEEKYLLQEVADMYRKDVGMLQNAAAATLHKIEKLTVEKLPVNINLPMHCCQYDQF